MIWPRMLRIQMATKSKTQRAKASERRQARKAAKLEGAIEETPVAAASAEEPKKGLFKKSEPAAEDKKPEKVESKPKKTRFQFLKDVRSEMKRVTWPSRVDVLRWSGVVIVALLFFGIYVALLDNAIITPLLIAFSGLGA